MSLRERLDSKPRFKSRETEFMGEPVEIRSLSLIIVQKIADMQGGHGRTVVKNGKPQPAAPTSTPGERQIDAAFLTMRHGLYDPETQEPVFGDGDKAVIADYPFEDVLAITNEIQELSGLTKEAQEQAGKEPESPEPS